MPDLESHYPSQARSAAAWLGEIARLSQTKVHESTELSHFSILNLPDSFFTISAQILEGNTKLSGCLRDTYFQ